MQDTPRDAGRLLRPTAVTDSGDVEPSRRGELYRSYFSDPLPFSVVVPEGDFRVRIEDWRLPGFVFSVSSIGAYASHWNVRRPPAGNMGLVMVRMLVSGSVTGLFDGRQVRIGPGDIYMMDFDCEAIKLHADCRYRTFYLPHAALGSEPGRLATFRHIQAGSPQGLLLSATIRGFADGLPRTPVGTTRTVADGLTGVFAALLPDPDRDLDQADLAGGRRAAIKDFVTSAPARTPMKAADLCARFHISRATLYRMFAEDGGVDRFVTVQRMRAAYRELAGTTAVRGAVRRVAERWGFEDPAAFSRAFRTRFGIAPSDLLSSAQQGGDPGAEDDANAAASALFSDELLSLE